MAAKGKYDDFVDGGGLLLVEGWCMDGFSDKELYESMHISKDTFYRWRSEHEEFSDAIKKGRKPVRVSVKKGFYSRCEWRVEAETTFEKIKRHGEVVEERERTVMRVFPPDPAITIFAMKNLFKDEFKQNPTDDADNAMHVEKAREILSSIDGVI